MTIAVLFGGKSGEHEVSLISARSVVRNINRSKHSIVLIGITKAGLWYEQEEAFLESLSITEQSEQAIYLMPGGGTKKALHKINGSGDKQFLPIDIVLPILHGSYGEDGLLQGLLEMLELPYCGCGVAASALAMDKEKTKQIWLQEGLPVVPFVCVKSARGTDKSVLLKITEAEKKFGYPLFVKPCCAGSSVGTAKTENRSELQTALAEALTWDEKVLIEPFIAAREVECSVTGNSIAPDSEKNLYLRSYVPGEIIPNHSFYDYDAKYIDPNGAKLIIPAELSPAQIDSLKLTAEKAYSALDCSGFARVDFFIDKKNGTVYLNEINSLPGFTSISMFPKMCEAGGLDYSSLIELLLQLGLERFAQRRCLKTSR